MKINRILMTYKHQKERKKELPSSLETHKIVLQEQDTLICFN